MKPASILLGSWNLSGCASDERHHNFRKALCATGVHFMAVQDTKTNATVRMAPWTGHFAPNVGLVIHDELGPHKFKLHTPDIASVVTTTGTVLAMFSVYVPHGATSDERNTVLEDLLRAIESCGTKNFVIGGDFNETWADFADVTLWAKFADLSNTGQGKNTYFGWTGGICTPAELDYVVYPHNTLVMERQRITRPRDFTSDHGLLTTRLVLIRKAKRCRSHSAKPRENKAPIVHPADTAEGSYTRLRDAATAIPITPTKTHVSPFRPTWSKETTAAFEAQHTARRDLPPNDPGRKAAAKAVRRLKRKDREAAIERYTEAAEKAMIKNASDCWRQISAITTKAKGRLTRRTANQARKLLKKHTNILTSRNISHVRMDKVPRMQNHPPPSGAPIHAYCDGSWIPETKQGSYAYIAILPNGHIRAFYGSTGIGNSKSSTAEEARAILLVMQHNRGKIIHVYTDSLNCISNLVKIRILAASDFRTTAEPDLWRQIAKETAFTRVIPHKVKGHSGVWGNELADKVADIGTLNPIPEGEARALVFNFAEAMKAKEFYDDCRELMHHPQENVPGHAFTPGPCPFLHGCDDPPTREEIHAILRSLPLKAPGPDGVSVAQLRGLEKEVYDFVLLCWTRLELPSDIGKSFLASIPKPNSTDERGISIVQSIEQVFMKLILWRNAHCPLRDAQYGFRKARSGPQAIYLTRHLIHRKKLMCFIDLKKAFDTVNRDALFALLPSYGFGANTIAMLKLLYDHDSALLKVDGMHVGNIKATIGVKQGSVLSPLLFIIFMDHVFALLSFDNAREITLLAYADDIVIFADSELQLRQRIAEFNTAVTSLGMNINVGKTKVMDSTTAHTWSLSGQANHYSKRNIPIRAGKNTCLGANDTRLYIPARRMQGRRAIKVALNCPFTDCLYSAGTTRTRSVHNLLRSHLQKYHRIIIAATGMVHQLFVPASTRLMNAPVTAVGRHDDVEQDTQRFVINAEGVKEVNAFRYLGSITAANDSLMPDLKRRRTLTAIAIRSLHKVTKRFSREHAVRTYETFVLPILLFGCETYQPMNTKEQAYFNASYMNVWRRATKMTLHPAADGTLTQHSNVHVLAAARQRTPEQALLARQTAFLADMQHDPLIAVMPRWT